MWVKACVSSLAAWEQGGTFFDLSSDVWEEVEVVVVVVVVMVVVEA